MTQATKLYPIGIQTFEKIRNGNYLYIDKTEIIYRLTHAASNYVFLSRPRRFGKSLLTSTLKAYFEGRRDLFKGLAMERLETEWTEYPVLHFDMSLGKHMEKEQLERYLLSQLEQIEEDYGIHSDSPDSNIRLTKLIRHVYEQTGCQVVVLVDEYDAPCSTWRMKKRTSPSSATLCVTSIVRSKPATLTCVSSSSPVLPNFRNSVSSAS